MPYKRKYKKRRSYRRNKPVALTTTNNIFPNSVIVRHRYVTTISLDAGLTSAAAHLFRANSVNDPDYTGVGHQALGYDEMTPLYTHSTVLGSKITCNYVSNGTDNMMVGCYLNNDTSPVTTYDTIAEQGKGVYKLMTPAAGSSKIVQKFSAKKFFGVKDVSDNEKLSAGVGSNPAEEAFYIVWAQSHSSSYNPASFFATVTIEYLVLWTERQSLLQS